MLAVAQRAGSRPSTTAKIPHSQTNQQPADAHFLTQVLDEAASWPDVVQGASGISVEGARALSLADGVAGGLPEAFMVGREFCHGHAQGDYSLHMTLPLELVDAIDASGWIEPHFLVLTGQLPRTHVMVYAPRDGQEVAVVTGLVRASYEFARGLAQA